MEKRETPKRRALTTRLTSPMVLIILSVVLAAGIVGVDRGYVRPYLDRMSQQGIYATSFDTQRQVSVEMGEEMGRLDAACQQLTDNHHNSVKQLRTQLPELSEVADVSAAAILDANGQAVFVYVEATHDSDHADEVLLESTVATDLQRQFPALRNTETGLLAIATEGQPHIMVYSMRPLAADTDNGSPRHYLCLGRDISDFLPADVHLMGMERLTGGSKTTQLDKNLTLTTPELLISWPLFGPDEKPLAYLEAQPPLGRHLANAQGTRKMTLSILSLAVGLTLLIMTGVYILIAGPIFRLVRRLHTSRVADGDPTGLVEGLHGEARELATTLTEAFGRLSEMSQTDSLTRLANRRHFDQVKDAMFNQAVRYGWPLSLIAIDVDYFKAVNDTGGHDVGDALLKTVAGALTSACRNADVAARVGGDEFAVLLPETTIRDANLVAERIRRDLAKQDVITAADIKISLSIGIASTELPDAQSSHALQVAADRALYQAKEAGRDRISLATQRDDDQSTADADFKAYTLYKKRISQDARFKQLFLSTLQGFIDLFEKRAPHMVDQARKTQYYAERIAKEMGLSESFIQRIQLAACIHNVGMLTLPDSILSAQSSLTEAERDAIRMHPIIGTDIMEQMEFLDQEVPAVRYHHEAFDGSGYPEGLVGSAIPLAARIIAVADAFDAITTDRSYRPAKNFEEALREMQAHSGTQFDPQVVDALVRLATREGECLLWGPAPATHFSHGTTMTL